MAISASLFSAIAIALSSVALWQRYPEPTSVASSIAPETPTEFSCDCKCAPCQVTVVTRYLESGGWLALFVAFVFGCSCSAVVHYCLKVLAGPVPPVPAAPVAAVLSFEVPSPAPVLQLSDVPKLVTKPKIISALARRSLREQHGR